MALITIEVHARDVIDRLAKAGCASASDFEWVSQLRFYWDKGVVRGGGTAVPVLCSARAYRGEEEGGSGAVCEPRTACEA